LLRKAVGLLFWLITVGRNLISILICIKAANVVKVHLIETGPCQKQENAFELAAARCVETQLSDVFLSLCILSPHL